MATLLTAQDVADRLGVAPSWVWAQARAGRIPAWAGTAGSGRKRSRRGSRTSSGRPRKILTGARRDANTTDPRRDFRSQESFIPRRSRLGSVGVVQSRASTGG